MSGFRFSFPACVIAVKGRIAAEDVLMLRKYSFPDGLRSPEDARTLLALNRTAPDSAPEWTSYLVESLTMFLLYGSDPAGDIDENKAAWLKAMLAEDGVIQSAVELEILLHVVEVAPEVPESLSALALDQLRLALLQEPCGAYHALRPMSSTATPHDTAFVWRILRGALDYGRLMLSPLETAVLCEIDALMVPTDRPSAWKAIMGSVVTLERPKGHLRSRPWLVLDDNCFSDSELAA